MHALVFIMFIFNNNKFKVFMKSISPFLSIISLKKKNVAISLAFSAELYILNSKKFIFNASNL